MAKLEVEKLENEITINSVGLCAHASFDPAAKVAEVIFEQATNVTSALEAVVNILNSEALRWKIPILQIDIIAGKFVKQLTQIAPRFGFTGPEIVYGQGSTNPIMKFHGEFSVPQNPQALFCISKQLLRLLLS